MLVGFQPFKLFAVKVGSITVANRFTSFRLFTLFVDLCLLHLQEWWDEEQEEEEPVEDHVGTAHARAPASAFLSLS